MNDIQSEFKKDIDKSYIEALKDKKIYFGHASVGSNIIEGIEEIKATDQSLTSINIINLDSTAYFDKPGIFHGKNGKNGDTKSKVDAFQNLLHEDGFGNKLDIAFFKFCYVDFNRDSNVEEIFNYYSSSIKGIKRDFPRLKIIHVTTPLYAHVWGLKGFIKNILYSDISNVNRNQFNKLLVKQYMGVDPIYDLAMIESSNFDGGKTSFNYKGNEYLALSKENTDDGGHLNKVGKFMAARDLLKILSETVKE